jgi:hypothetical protein
MTAKNNLTYLVEAFHKKECPEYYNNIGGEEK